MKKFKKTLAFSMALMLALTACGSQPAGNSGTPSESPTAEPVATPEATAEPTPEPTATPKPEKGVVESYTQSAETIAKNEELWKNREFTTRRMEQLDRGLVAINTEEGVFVSWRWLGDESNEVEYNLYRDGKRVNPFALNVTNYTDMSGTAESTYQVAAVVNGVEQEKCDAVSVWADASFEIALNKPEPYVNKYQGIGYYSPNEISVADLDGDGEYEFVLKWIGDDSKDNSQSGITSPTILDAYEMDGTQMWRINLGPNIRTGAHYTQFMVYDLDGDGKAEVVCKTADATVDGAGTSIGDATAYYADVEGRILKGPEYLTVFSGETGCALDTIEYEPGRGTITEWGDGHGNRCDRFLACVAYLNGSTPSVVMCRGYYARAYLVAYDFVDGKLQKVWSFDSNEAGNEAVAGQGNHSVAVADVDMDGKDEIMYGAAAIDHDGTFMYATGLGHGDAQHTGDLIPSRAGLEVFSVHEPAGARYGVEMRDAMTGEILFGSYENSDVGRGVSADIDPKYPGNESWAAGKMISSTGEVISQSPSISYNFRIYWDGDLGEELQDGNHIDKWVSEKNSTKLLLSAKGYTSTNGTKATPGITCDLLGDWREETILFNEDGNSMAIFASTIPTDYKIYTLMHDLQYRTYVTTQNVAYNQPPHTGYYLGYDTTEIPVPRVTWAEGETQVTNPDLAAGKKYYALETLMREKSAALKVGTLYAYVGDFMTRVDSANNAVAPYESNGQVFVPLSFLAESFGVKAEYKSGTCTIDGKAVTLEAAAETVSGTVCVPVSAVKALGKTVTVDASGLVVIRDEAVELDAETIQILTDVITGYVEPEKPVEQEPISAEKLAANQIPVVAVEASTHDGNMAEGAVDGNFSTRWNGWDDGATLTVDLGESKKVAAVAAAFYKGDERHYYFDIQVSADGKEWTTVLEAQKSPMAEENTLTAFNFPEVVEARYVRYVGHNSSENNANNMWEFVVLAP